MILKKSGGTVLISSFDVFSSQDDEQDEYFVSMLLSVRSTQLLGMHLSI